MSACIFVALGMGEVAQLVVDRRLQIDRHLPGTLLQGARRLADGRVARIELDDVGAPPWGGGSRDDGGEARPRRLWHV